MGFRAFIVHPRCGSYTWRAGSAVLPAAYAFASIVSSAATRITRIAFLASGGNSRLRQRRTAIDTIFSDTYRRTLHAECSGACNAENPAKDNQETKTHRDRAHPRPTG